MRPAAETLAQTIDVMLERKGHGWDEQLAMELESRIITATSPPLYLGTSIMATRNATLALALTSPAHPNLSADGALRQPMAMESDAQSSLEKMRKLIAAGSRAGAGAAPFQLDWLVLRAKEQYEAVRLHRERGGFLPQGSQGPAPSTGGDDAPKPPAVDDKKKKGKKRPNVEEEEKPKSKKKKKQPAASSAAAASDAADGEKKKPPAKKEKGVATEKKKKVEKKKD